MICAERDRGQVFLGLVVDDLDVVAVADHLADLIERDVPAVLRVVELAIGVSLDDPRLGHGRSPGVHALVDGRLNDSKRITHRAMTSTSARRRYSTTRGARPLIARLKAIRDPRMRALALVEALGEGDAGAWVEAFGAHRDASARRSTTPTR